MNTEIEWCNAFTFFVWNGKKVELSSFYLDFFLHPVTDICVKAEVFFLTFILWTLCFEWCTSCVLFGNKLRPTTVSWQPSASNYTSTYPMIKLLHTRYTISSGVENWKAKKIDVFLCALCETSGFYSSWKYILWWNIIE